MSFIILGLGESGLAAAKFCAQHNITFEVVDTRDKPPNIDTFRTQFPHIKVYTDGFHPEVLARAKTIVLSPGIPKDHPELRSIDSSQTEIIGDIELFARILQTHPELSAPIVSITGSNGKSTVTTLVGEIAKASGLKTAVGGNLGTPALSLMASNLDLYVLELSSFQLETTSTLKSDVATILNICEDHMDRYSSLEEYLTAKARIFNQAQMVVANRDDGLVAERLPSDRPIRWFGSQPPLGENYGLHEVGERIFLSRGEEKLLPLSEMKLFGRHNAMNALAALALSESIGLPLDAGISVLKNFGGLSHRCERVRDRNGVIWINDSKGTNVGATVAALIGLGEEIPGKWVLIAGGISKNADFSPLKEIVKQYCRAVVLIGEAASTLETLLTPVVQCMRTTTLEEAVRECANIAKPGDGVLLSPACASFDMFKNFEDRGEKFKAAVVNL